MASNVKELLLFCADTQIEVNDKQNKKKEMRILPLLILEDKKEYRTQTIEEAMLKVETDSITDFERVFNLLTNYIDRKLITDTHNFLRHHHDNYGFIKAQDLLAKNLPNLTTNDAHLR